jgi:hypothetical protein
VGWPDVCTPRIKPITLLALSLIAITRVKPRISQSIRAFRTTSQSRRNEVNAQRSHPLAKTSTSQSQLLGSRFEHCSSSPDFRLSIKKHPRYPPPIATLSYNPSTTRHSLFQDWILDYAFKSPNTSLRLRRLSLAPEHRRQTTCEITMDGASNNKARAK